MKRRPSYQKYGEVWLKRYFEQFGSWDEVARHFGLPSRATAWNMAHGKQPIPHDLFKRMSGLDKIQSIAVPFLQQREQA